MKATTLFFLVSSFLSAVVSTAVQKRYIFRQDDVEDWNANTVQASLMNFFMDRGIGVTLGIIGDFVSGQDAIIYNALKRCASMSKDKCAFFNHGSDAKLRFGDLTNYTASLPPMKRCDDNIHRLFPGYKVEVFVPNENSWNEYTLEAARALGYGVISASEAGYSGMKYNLTSNPIMLPQQTTTGQYQPDGTWKRVPTQQTVSECETAAAKGEVCVIMLHPHEFANGQYTLPELDWLVNNLTAHGFVSTNFHSVLYEAKGLTESPTVTPTLAPTSRQPTLAPTAPTRAPTQLKKRFIFRQDDVEDWDANTIQTSLMNFFMDRGIGVTLGIIGDYLSGKDTLIYNALKRCVNLGEAKCALFNRGANAVVKYGDLTNVTAAYNPMKRCDEKIKRLFPGYKVEGFLPYGNSWNDYTLQAMRALGYSVISASEASYSNMKYSLDGSPMQLPQQTATGQYVNGQLVKVPIQQTVSECEAAALKGEVCVIMLSPHEFANGQYSLAELEWLVNNLTAHGFVSTNFHSVLYEAKGLTESPTTAPTLAPTKTSTIAPSASAANSQSNVASTGFISAHPSGVAIMVYIVAALLFVFIVYFGRQYITRKSLNKDEVNTTNEELNSIELGLSSNSSANSENEEKYLPTTGYRGSSVTSSDHQSLSYSISNQHLQPMTVSTSYGLILSSPGGGGNSPSLASPSSASSAPSSPVGGGMYSRSSSARPLTASNARY